MNLALFDFDGTITHKEMLPAFLYQAVAPRRLVIGQITLAPLIIGYKLGVVSGSVVRAAILRFGFSGMPLAALEAHALRFAQAVLPGAIRPEASERIQWHKSRGDTVVVVSGAFEIYLRHWCHEQQLGLMGSLLEHRSGILTGRYLGRQCVGDEKARRVREAFDLTRYERIYAYGDTREDRALLSLAHERWYRWQRVDA